jgi:hypothetical protein
MAAFCIEKQFEINVELHFEWIFVMLYRWIFLWLTIQNFYPCQNSTFLLLFDIPVKSSVE